MNIPTPLAETLAAELNSKIVDARAVGGGSICNTVRAALEDGREVLVKWLNGAGQMFTVERKGLELLRAAAALRVPQVFAQAEAANGRPGYIVMEWLGNGRSNRSVDEALGQGLAELHRTTAEQYGLDHDNLIGANPQPNSQADNWVDFFREQRLGYQMELMGQNGYLNSRRRDWLDRLLANLDNWLPAEPPASLLHGDLWGGNWLTTAAGEPALIDPAVYYGHREAELAFTELFGGFSGTFYSAYDQSWPLESDYRERKDLYNLYHLMNHLNLFGEGYGGRVDSILRRFAG